MTERSRNAGAGMSATPAADTSAGVSSGLVASSALAGLLERVAAGDTTAFEQLYTATYGTVLHVSHAVLLDHGQAEEVTQEVFLEIWRRAEQFNSTKGSAASWIWRIAHARAVDRVRHAQAARVNDHRYAQHHFERDVDSVAEAALRKSEIATLHTVLPTLTALQRQALLLTYYAGHTTVQASALLGVPQATLKSRVLDALVALRRAHPGYE